VTGYAHLAAAATGVQVGAAMAMSAAAVAETGASTLAFLRYGVGLAILVPALRGAWRILPGTRDLLVICATGAAQFGLLVVLLNMAVATAPASQVALVFATMPLMALALSALAEGRAVTRCQAVAVCGAVAATGLVLGRQALAASPSVSALPGLGLAALATLVGAACALVHQPQIVRHGVARVSGLSMAAALPFLALATLLEGWPVLPRNWSEETVALVLGLGASSGLGILLWLTALERLPAGVASAFLGLGPVTALVIGWAALGTPTHPVEVAAAALVLGSLILLARCTSIEPAERKSPLA